MPKDDSLADLLIAGGLGYLLAKGQNNEWKPVIENYKKRLEHLKFSQTPIPFGFLDQNSNMKIIYRESVFCFLFGFSNSCLPSLMRVLEQALISKYERTENKKPPNDMALADLIDWAEKLLKEKTQVAHSFRMLRNYVHSENLISQQDASEGIRHISIVIDNIFPKQSFGLNVTCPSCRKIETITIQPQMGVLGNTVGIRCGGCGVNYNWLVFP